MRELVIVLPAFALSLGLTLLLECLVALFFHLGRRDLLLLLLVNLLTNPVAVYLNLLFRSFFPQAVALVWQIPLELAVVVTEGLLYAKCAQSIRKPWLLALLANAASYGTGLLLSLVF